MSGQPESNEPAPTLRAPQQPSPSQSPACHKSTPCWLKTIPIPAKSPNKQGTTCTRPALSVGMSLLRSSVFVFQRSSHITGPAFIQHNSPLFSVPLTLFAIFTLCLLLSWQLSVQHQPYISNVVHGFMLWMTCLSLPQQETPDARLGGTKDASITAKCSINHPGHKSKTNKQDIRNIHWL